MSHPVRRGGAYASSHSSSSLCFASIPLLHLLLFPIVICIQTVAGRSVTTFAGNTASGYVDGPADTTARFYSTTGIAGNPTTGDIYVADFGNSRIRLVKDGVVSTLATVSNPYHLAVNPNTGDIYATSYTTNTLLRVSPDTGTVTTVATGFNDPVGVNVNPTTGDIYVGDFSNHRIAAVTPGGTVSILVTGWTNPCGVYFNPTNEKIYVAGNTHDIRLLALDGTFTVIAGSSGSAGYQDGDGAAARFNSPHGILVNPATGNVYVGDTNNQRIRLIQPNGTVSTLAGSGTAGFLDGDVTTAQFNGPNAIFFDATNGNLYIAVHLNNAIRLIGDLPAVPTLSKTHSGTISVSSSDSGSVTSSLTARSPSASTSNSASASVVPTASRTPSSTQMVSATLSRQSSVTHAMSPSAAASITPVVPLFTPTLPIATVLPTTAVPSPSSAPPTAAPTAPASLSIFTATLSASSPVTQAQKDELSTQLATKYTISSTDVLFLQDPNSTAVRFTLTGINAGTTSTLLSVATEQEQTALGIHTMTSAPTSSSVFTATLSAPSPVTQAQKDELSTQLATKYNISSTDVLFLQDPNSTAVSFILTGISATTASSFLSELERTALGIDTMTFVPLSLYELPTSAPTPLPPGVTAAPVTLAVTLMPTSAPTEFHVTQPVIQGTEVLEEGPLVPGEVTKITIAATVSRNSSSTTIVVRCAASKDVAVLSDGLETVSSEVTFEEDITDSGSEELELPLYLVGPPAGSDVNITCNVGGEVVELTVVAAPATSTEITTPLITGAYPPLSDPLPAKGGDVILTGPNMSALPPRIMVGPYVVPIRVVNDTYAIADVPAQATCGELSSSGEVAGTSVEDKVFGWQCAANDATTKQRLTELCAGKSDETLIGIQDFSWDGSNSVKPAPIMLLTLSLELDLDLDLSVGISGRRQSSASSVQIEAGAPAVNVTARFHIVDGLTGEEVDTALLEQMPTTTAVSTTSDFKTPLPVYRKNSTAIILTLHAGSQQITDIPLYIERGFGPRRYTFSEAIPVLRPQISASLVLVNNRSVILSLMSHGGTAQNVTVSMYGEARVATQLASNNSRCSSVYPGLSCTVPSVAPDNTAMFPVYIDVPTFYKRDVIVHFTVDGTNVVSPISGYELIQGSISVGSGSGGPSSPSSSAAPGTKSPVAAQVPGSALRGIFGSTDNTALCLDPLIFTVLAGLAGLVLMIICSKTYLKTNEKSTFHDVPLWRSLLLQHAWFSLCVPCHAGCAVGHAISSFSYVMLCSILCRLLLSGATVNGMWLVGVLSVLLAQPLRPLMSYYYWAWKGDRADFQQRSDEFHMTLRRKSTAAMKQVIHATDSNLAAMVSEAGLAALDDIELVEEHEVASDTGDEEESVFATTTTVEDSEPSMRLQEDEEPRASPALLVVDSATPTGGTLGHLRDADNEGEEEVAVVSSEEDPTTRMTSTNETDVDAATSEADAEDCRHPVDTPTICDPYVIRGHLVNAAFLAISITITFLMLRELTTGDSCNLLLRSFIIAVVVDVVIVQTATVILVYAYRWIAAEDEDTVWSELHPRHGENRPF